MEPPRTHYARSGDGFHIAYQTVGTGAHDVVLVQAMAAIDTLWDEPSLARVLFRIADIGRLICIDPPGLGASDPATVGDAIPEVWMDYVSAVLDAVGSSRTTIIATSGAAFLALLFGATYPDRTAALVLVDCSARIVWADDYPSGLSSEVIEMNVDRIDRHWGSGASIWLIAPSRGREARLRSWFARAERALTPPGPWTTALRWNANLDLRPILPSIKAQTLVVHAESAALVPVNHGQYLAKHIPGARLTILPGADSPFFSQDADAFVDLVAEFITGTRPSAESDRVLATVLFTDVVASTEHAARLGDKRWTRLLDQHDALISRELDRHRGRRVNPTGDGIFAIFDGPARAVRCAQAICDAVGTLGIEVRAGLHTGEVELRGGDIGGIAVHIGQRVSALAGPGEVVVSSTVVDLVAGSGLEFDDRGEHGLKGVPRTWRLYAVRP